MKHRLDRAKYFLKSKVKVKVISAGMGHKVGWALISVSVALGHSSAGAAKATEEASPPVATRVFLSLSLTCQAPN